ncbi:unnamed protein product [Musa acuminata subsp. burmannicoides]
MQPPVDFLHRHLLHHHHHHIPLVLLCPCSCHRRHHHCHLLPRFASPNPHLPPPCHHLPLPHIPCSSFSQVLPNRTSPHLVQDQSSMSRIGAERPEAAEVVDFPASESQEQEWNENQVPEGEEDVFVLTDEWMEFFAKSEAKRKLAKQQKKKGRK